MSGPGLPHEVLGREAWQASSIGWLEWALPLWSRRWRLAIAGLAGALLGFGLATVQPVRFTGHASFVVQPVQRPSQSVVASALPALAGLAAAGPSAIDLQVAILRSQSVSDRIVERFDLQHVWGLQHRADVARRLARRVEFGVGRREGLVQVDVEDESPQRAASMANEYIEELRLTLRRFALDEARQRRAFYEAQLVRARSALEQAQQKLQRSGFDRAALRAEPRAAAEGYGRLEAEIAAAEVRLAAARKVRAEDSAEVQQQLAELAALRAQLGRLEVPRDDGPGSFVARLREYRYAETFADSIARQAEAARVDEASEPLPLQILDPAKAPEFPSHPQPLRWLLAGLAAGFGLQGTWVVLRHRARLARLDAAYASRLALVRSVLPARRS